MKKLFNVRCAKYVDGEVIVDVPVDATDEQVKHAIGRCTHLFDWREYSPTILEYVAVFEQEEYEDRKSDAISTNDQWPQHYPEVPCEPKVVLEWNGDHTRLKVVAPRRSA